jgi:hypothetical protein
VSRHGSLLPIPDDPIFPELTAAWPQFQEAYRFPRSAWLGSMEYQLKAFYPQSSSADRKLTARHYAPFPLRDGPNVP